MSGIGTSMIEKEMLGITMVMGTRIRAVVMVWDAAWGWEDAGMISCTRKSSTAVINITAANTAVGN
jgi:hypothetical protein